MITFDVKTPTPDPIVDEVRPIRAEISAAFDNDVSKLCEHLRSLEEQYKDRLVTGPLRPRSKHGS